MTPELPRQSNEHTVGWLNAGDREAEANRQANDYIERAARAASSGSSVGSREWMQAAEVALKVAILARSQQPGRTYRVIDGERWYLLDG